MVRTKIVCTIGPASRNETILRKMMLKGMDIARLNFSHGSHKEHKQAVNLIRKLNKKYRRNIKILQDLEGYRIRIGRFNKGRPLDLKKNQTLVLSNSEKHSTGTIPFDYEGDLKKIPKGTLIYIDDGKISLKIIASSKNSLKAKAIYPGTIKERKGVNIPGIKLEFSGITQKDLDDIEFGIKNKVDFIAQSFVRSSDDLNLINKIVKKRHPKCKIIAKIENTDGIRNIDEIMKAADGIMIARGDMGISVPIYKVPILQKEIIRKCNQKKKFVITATQMLESMTEFPIPTRAEVTDVSNAVIDGTDIVMLSAETASGKYPVETVDIMNKILKFTENSGFLR